MSAFSAYLLYSPLLLVISISSAAFSDLPGLPSRSINYDEKDPFLCNACGFCKYARFDFMLYAKPCCAVDPIENEEDRKKVGPTADSLTKCCISWPSQQCRDIRGPSVLGVTRKAVLLQCFLLTNAFSLILVISQNPHSCLWHFEKYGMQSLIYSLHPLSRSFCKDIIQCSAYKPSSTASLWVNLGCALYISIPSEEPC